MARFDIPAVFSISAPTLTRTVTADAALQGGGTRTVPATAALSAGINIDLQILTQPGSTGNQTYSLASDFDPKAVIFWAVPMAADGTAASYALGIGFGTYRGAVVQQRYTTMRSLDAAATGDMARGEGTTAALVLLTQSAGAATKDLEVRLVSMQTGATSQVVLNWVNLHTTASIRIYMLVLGGPDITDALVDDLTITTAATTQNETVVSGFGRPDLLFVMGDGPNGTDSAVNVTQFFGFGKQAEAGRGVGWAHTDGSAASQLVMAQRSDRLVLDYLPSGTGSSTVRAVAQLDTTVANWPTDGFRLVYDSIPGNADALAYLALRTTASVATGASATQTSGVATPNDIAVPFGPKAILAFGWNMVATGTAVASDTLLGAFGIGAYDGTDQAWAGVTDDDDAATLDSNNQQDTTKILSFYTRSAANLVSIAASFSGNNLRMTQSGGNDLVAREYHYIAFGNAGAVRARTVTADAALQGTGTRTAPATAALQGGGTRTVPATAALSLAGITRTVPATASLSWVLTRMVPATAALQGVRTRTVPATAAFQGTGTRAVPTTAALSSTNQRTVPATAALQGTGIRMVPATAALSATLARTVSATAALSLAGILRTVPASAATSQAYTRTVPATVALSLVLGRTVPADAALQGIGTRTVPATAALSLVLAHTVPATAALSQVYARTVPATAALSQVNARTVPATAALQGILARTVPASAALQGVGTRPVPASAALSLAGLSRAVPATAALSALLTRSVPASAALSLILARTVPATAALSGTNQRIVGADTALQGVSGRIVPATAALASAGSLTRTVPVTAALSLSGLTRTVAATAALAGTNQRIVPVTAALSLARARTVPADATLLQAGLIRIVPASAATSQVLARSVPATVALQATVARLAPASAALQGVGIRTVPATAALQMLVSFAFVAEGDVFAPLAVDGDLAAMYHHEATIAIPLTVDGKVGRR